MADTDNVNQQTGTTDNADQSDSQQSGSSNNICPNIDIQGPNNIRLTHGYDPASLKIKGLQNIDE